MKAMWIGSGLLLLAGVGVSAALADPSFAPAWNYLPGQPSFSYGPAYYGSCPWGATCAPKYYPAPVSPPISSYVPGQFSGAMPAQGSGFGSPLPTFPTH